MLGDRYFASSSLGISANALRIILHEYLKMVRSRKLASLFMVCAQDFSIYPMLSQVDPVWALRWYGSGGIPLHLN